MDKPTVLIIDDVKFNIKAVQDMIGDRYKIIGALSAEAGLHVLSHSIPDLILLDIIMPGTDGHEVLKTIKANPDYKDIPIIFLTADSNYETEVEGFNEGVVDYITKPFVADVLSKRIENQIQLSEYKKFLRRKADNSINEAISSIGSLAKKIDSNPLYAGQTDMELIEKVSGLIPEFSHLADIANKNAGADIDEATAKEFWDALEKIKVIL